MSEVSQADTLASSAATSFSPIVPSPLDFPDSPLSLAVKQPLMLGLFLNFQDIRVSTYPTGSTWTFDHNAEIVRLGDSLGFEIVFSRTQWLPKGGYDGDASLDSFIGVAAFAPITKRILLISTIHVLYGPWHPLHLAKYGSTLDHISKGRWGINIVTGHRAVEHLWSDTENFSHASRLSSWKIRNGYITPKPLFGRPVLVTATGSEAGIAFAAQYSDLLFITSPGGAHIDSALATLPAHIANIHQAAARFGRHVKTIINPLVVCRDTSAEAHDYAHAIARNKLAPTNSTGFGNYDSDAHAWRGRLNQNAKQGLGLGGNIEIIGSPEEVVDQLVALKRAGIDGVQLGFYDFLPELRYFGERVLPLMKQAGLRL
ncbi:luciferase [Acetobacter senegalensis]|uniref:Luciferase n=1 Tax=Acetobacter senegalensis TaxID=446692 RepID=A0A149TYV8_9PROT|nr:LLM class flavin-dependent oxidoreductase [Acetobacter senegalensis]KXV58351.1 luciferase [Acetobacter senegalensis]